MYLQIALIKKNTYLVLHYFFKYFTKKRPHSREAFLNFISTTT